MKIWFKIWENTHLLKSETIEDDTEDTRTHKIFHALEEVCLKWDLGKPIWFDANIAEFQRHARTRFGKDNFVEETFLFFIFTTIAAIDVGIKNIKFVAFCAQNVFLVI